MGIFAWLVLGLMSGLIASRLVNHRGAGMILDVVLGIIGSFMGGLLFNFFGAPSLSSFSIVSVFVGVMGATVTLVLYYALMGRRHVWTGRVRTLGLSEQGEAKICAERPWLSPAPLRASAPRPPSPWPPKARGSFSRRATPARPPRP